MFWYGRWILLYRKNGEWILENLTDKDHIRGALKHTEKKQQIGA
jgi:hypothetical protein